MSKFKNQKLYFYNTVTIQYGNEITRFLNLLGLYCFAFTALAIDKTFIKQTFLPSKSETVSIYFPIKI